MENENRELTATKLHPEEALLSWEAPEFVSHERDKAWYIGAGALVLTLLGYSIYTKDWFFIGVLVVLLAATWKYLHIEPKRVQYGLSRVGVTIGDKLYSYDELHSFWVVYQPPVKTINILSSRKYMPQLSIQLEDEDPVVIKNILKKFIPEQERRGEAPLDKISRILKF